MYDLSILKGIGNILISNVIHITDEFVVPSDEDFDQALEAVDLVEGSNEQNILHFSAEVAMSKQDGATVTEGDFDALSTFTLAYN